MTPERWSQIKEVFRLALGLPESEQSRFLESACSGDAELRAEVERLLAGNEEPTWQSPAAKLFTVAAELAPGDTIAHYRIEARLGEGGMGVVYKARDTRLGRSVALKFVKAQFSSRGQREARAVAALNHPNICTLHDVGSNYMVMELIEGPTLAERIAKGPIPLQEALEIARQIAEGLEAAHEMGIVHRDLKPANIKVTAEGRVKVLDFGLAKAGREEAGLASDSLTLSAPGMIMGTVGYMSPEQARGQKVDKRTDIWAFGVMLYEMVAGQRPFEGDAVPDTLAAIITREPDWTKIPAGLQRVLRLCLEKDPHRRLRDISGVALLLEATGGAEGPARTGRPSHKAWIAAVAVPTVIAAAALWAAWRAGKDVGSYPLTRLSVDLGPDALTGLNLTAAISPDGRRLVFPVRAPDGKQQLATRLLDQAQTTLLPGTDNGHDPFFSPDSQWLGFFADGKLQKTSVQGGAPVTLCDATFDLGASWGEGGTIIAALNVVSGLSRVPAAGGRPQPSTELGKGESTHRWPQILPGGQVILFTASPSINGMENANIEAMRLKSRVTKTLVVGGYFGRYLPSNGDAGYLVYLHQGVLFGVAFDPVRLELQGAPVPILEDVAASPIEGGAQFDSAAAPLGHGTLVYLVGKGAAQTQPVVWLDSSGKMQPLIGIPGRYSMPRFSPDGRRLALTMTSSNGTDIYVYELERQTMTRLTLGGRAQIPVWSPDGTHMVFQSSASGFEIEWIRSDGSGEPQQLLNGQNTIVPWAFSPDGRRLAYFEVNPGTVYDISTLPLDTSDPDHPKPGRPEPFLATPSDEMAPMFSPDGRWIAYRSNESGTNEIYVRPFPSGRGGKWQISTGGGLYGIWSGNGKELFYETADNRIMVVDYTVNGDSFVPGKPRLWSEKQIYFTGTSNLALAPDGKRFAVFPMPDATGPEKGTVHVTFLLNFLDELRRRIPTGQ